MGQPPASGSLSATAAAAALRTQTPSSVQSPIQKARIPGNRIRALKILLIRIKGKQKKYFFS